MFKAMWAESIDCNAIIRVSWQGTMKEIDLRGVMENINMFNVNLGAWNRDVFVSVGKNPTCKNSPHELIEANAKGIG